MASYIRSLKGCIGPFIIIYTIVVTYFLALRAWDDVSYRLKHQNDARFLDVLVQEERRHLRSFQDVVKNYREDVEIEIGDKDNDHSKDEYNLNNTHVKRDGGFPSSTEAHLELDSRPRGTDSYGYYNEDVNYMETDSQKDVKSQFDLQVHVKKAPRPFYQVEVEEWDVNNVHPKQFPNSSDQYRDHLSESNYTKKYIQSFDLIANKLQSSRVDHENAMQPQKRSNVPDGGTYKTQFCEDVFEIFNSEPIICRRELAEYASSFHVNISTYSLLFRQLGDIFLFSAFLDTRHGSSFFIRLMVLAPQGRGSNKSIYWCVFHLPSHPLSTKSTPDIANITIDNKSPRRLATQLIYYSASDGHNKVNQFYIMSCPVPEAANIALLPPYRGLFQILIGELDRPFIETSQESVAIRIIKNNAHNLISYGDVALPNPSYFDQMEQDLLTLGANEVINEKKRVNDSITNSRSSRNSSNHSSNRSSNRTGSRSNSSKFSDVNTRNYNYSLHSSDIRVENGRLHIRNISNDKIVTCVAPLQGNIGIIQLVEFIELTLLLGSQHIVFYTFQVVQEIRKVLYMYEGRGLVTVLSWNLPYADSVWANGRDMSLNDCLYRTMHIYDYALFLDIDEFLVPRVTPDIPSFLKYLKAVHRFNSTRFSDLVFSSAYFPPPTKAQYMNITTMFGYTRDFNKFISLKSIHRTYFNPKHTIRMIKLDLAFRVGAGERKRTSFVISSRFAVAHHYSYCPQVNNVERKHKINVKAGTNGKDGSDICSHTKQDFIMWRYKSVLIQRVKDSVRRIHRG